MEKFTFINTDKLTARYCLLSLRSLSQRMIMASPIDRIFEEIFGHAPKKKGTAYEQIAAIVYHIVWGGEVRHDDRFLRKKHDLPDNGIGV